MEEKMKRFLTSLKVEEKDFNKFDMDFLSITRGVGTLKKPLFLCTVIKNTHFEFNTLLLLLNKLKNVDIDYQFSFVYKEKLSETYLKRFISDYFENTFFDRINDFNIELKNQEIIINFDKKSISIYEGSFENELIELINFMSLSQKVSIKYVNSLTTLNNEDEEKVEPIQKAENKEFNKSLIKSENIEEKEIVNEALSSQDCIDQLVEESAPIVDDIDTMFQKEATKINKELVEIEKKEEQEAIVRAEKRELYKKSSNYRHVEINDIDENSGAIEFKGKIYEVTIKDTKKRKGGLINLLVSDLKNSIYVTLFPSDKELETINFNNVNHKNIEIQGKVNKYGNSKEITVIANSFTFLEDDKLREDKSEEKRVELHLHTKMSEMDGAATISDYCALAKAWGMKAIAVTDHGVVQAFPEAQQAQKKYGVKILYGSELYLIPDFLNACINPTNKLLKECKYVAFDTETTGLSTRYDKIIEFGAVKVEGGMVVDRLDILINPGVEVSSFIEGKTHITNEMLKGQKTIKEAMPEILRFIGDYVLVSHNAPFDYEMFNEAFKGIYGRDFIHPVIDTIPLSRFIFPEARSHSLGNLCKRLEVEYDEDSAHRADYDAQVLASCWNALKLMIDERMENPTLYDLSALPYPKSLYKNLRGTHACVIAKNREGLKDLYKLISVSECEYIGTYPLVPRSLLNKYRKNLLVGSACFNGEVFQYANTRCEATLAKEISFYDYIEIQPLENYSFLLNIHEVISKERLLTNLKDIINEATKQNKLICATGDCHYLNPEDKIFRDVLISAQGVGKFNHPLNDYRRRNYPPFENPDQHFRSTSEMLECFAWLNDEARAKEYVITNPNKIADLCDIIIPIDDKLYTPTIDGCEDMLKNFCYKTAHEQYGDVLPEYIENRLKRELDGIINNGYSVTYWIAHELVRLTNEAGHIVGSRGSVGSSFAAYCAGITEVNALPPHYRCPHCKHVEFHDMSDGITSGYDLPEKVCPECGSKMIKDGQNIPFETFLGFKAEKVPDIDLNFPADFQSKAHVFTKDLLGADKVYRAGTISTLQDKTAFGYVRGYYEDWLHADLSKIRSAQLAALATGCTEVKRTTGQHPGGIVVVPREYEIYDFTPVQYPANDTTVEWKTTHFDFHAIHDTILKLDMLGHVDPQALRMMSERAKEHYGFKDIKDIPFDDKKVMSLFTGNEALNMQHKYIKEDVGSSGIPEFGTNFVKGLIRKAKPKSFKELLIVSGLSHGTDVWNNNAEVLISQGITDINGVIGCRDDIMSYLISMGLDNSKAFTIMETVRKGKKLSDEQIKDMQDHNVPSYYIDSCKKIKYLFPKGHACAYVMMALRVGYFKVYYPLVFYAIFFTLRCDQYEISTMLEGIDAIYNRINELNKRKSSSNPADKLSVKEEAILDTLTVCLEFAERGYKFEKIDVNRSDSFEFVIDKENNALIPPFKVLDGIGENGGDQAVKARKEREFDSYEDFVKRSKLPSKGIDQLKKLGTFNEMRESDELSLF